MCTFIFYKKMFTRITDTYSNFYMFTLFYKKIFIRLSSYSIFSAFSYHEFCKTVAHVTGKRNEIQMKKPYRKRVREREYILIGKSINPKRKTLISLNRKSKKPWHDSRITEAGYTEKENLYKGQESEQLNVSRKKAFERGTLDPGTMIWVK